MVQMNNDRYINLFTDFGFKKIFGEEPNKDLLISFLNELLEDEKISDLTYLKNERLGKRKADRSAIYDLYCENLEGEKFIVEVQRVKQEFFKDRSIYYSTFAIQEQAKKGNEWSYELKSVFTVAILDFSFDDTHADQLKHNVQLMEKNTREVFYNKLTFIYVEIPKFIKELHEVNTDFERWLFAFKNLHKLNDKPLELQDGVFNRLLEIAEISKLDKQDQLIYRESLKEYWDLTASMKTQFKEGRKKGKEEEKIATAKKLLLKGMEVDFVVEMTELPKEVVEKLKQKLQKDGLL